MMRRMGRRMRTRTGRMMRRMGRMRGLRRLRRLRMLKRRMTLKRRMRRMNGKREETCDHVDDGGVAVDVERLRR